MEETEVQRRIYAAVRKIPRGKVATYGQIARVAGLPGRARQVGWALRRLPEGTTVPWHRVVNAAGAISDRGDEEQESRQEKLLRKEKIPFSSAGRIPLGPYQWKVAADPGFESFRRLG